MGRYSLLYASRRPGRVQPYQSDSHIYKEADYFPRGRANKTLHSVSQGQGQRRPDTPEDVTVNKLPKIVITDVVRLPTRAKIDNMECSAILQYCSTKNQDSL